MRDARKWWLLIGGVVAFLVVFELLEDFFGTEPPASVEGASSQSRKGPGKPRVVRLDDGAVEVRHDMFRRTTIRLGDEDQEQALFECIEQGIEQTFGPDTADWSGRRVRRETERIQDACMGSLHRAPLPPRLPGSD